MIFFNDCLTMEDVKAKYRKLAMEHHPDRGGDQEVFKQLVNEYEFICAKILRDGNYTREETEERVKDNIIYKEIIEQLILLEGIVIDIVGQWIWVTGNTYPLRKELSSIGLHFAGAKKAWYYRPEYLKCARGSGKSLDEIKEKYGSETVGKSSGKRKIPFQSN